MGPNKLVLVVIALALILVGCNNQETPDREVNNLEGVSMEVLEHTVSPTNLRVVMNNNSDKYLVYGEEFSVERKMNNEWHELPIENENYGFTDIGYDLNPGIRIEEEINISFLYDQLEPGEYRVIKSVLEVREPGDYDEYYLTAEFSIE